MNKVRIGFIGSGSMGQRAHIANYALLPEVELAALAETRKETAKAVARHYGIKTVYPNHKEMLAKEQLDAVVGIMWFEWHHTFVPDVLEKGLPLLTEKAISVRVQTARKFLKLAQEKDSIYQIGYNKRFDPATQFVRAKIMEWKQSQEFGKLNYVRMVNPPGDYKFGLGLPIKVEERVRPENLKELPPEWMNQEQGDRYLFLVNFYIHQVNLVRYLLGEDYSVEHADPSGKILLGKSDSGVPIILEMETYNLGLYDWEEFHEFFFDRARIRLSLPPPMARQRAGEVEIYHNDGKDGIRQRPVIPQIWSMFEQARSFVEAVKHKKQPISPASDALKDLMIVEDYTRKQLPG